MYYNIVLQFLTFEYCIIVKYDDDLHVLDF
jgi:hypothetical protein